MWAKLNSARDGVDEIIVNMQPMVIDNITHPKALFTLWTDAERLAVGIVPVTTTGTHLDTAYYIEAEPTYAIAGNKKSVIRTIGVKDSDKSLSDLKTIAKNNATNEATRFLRGFGWLVQRKVTAETAIPSAVITYMAAIRTDHKNICDAIDGVANVDALVALTESWTSDTNVKSYRRNNFA
jgi:hypothetical protein|tara:strand:+ start:96 stop:638 length:543 start_codon:yes stop_codon:yes gene_type:complete